jgi:hypothetical protein
LWLTAPAPSSASAPLQGRPARGRVVARQSERAQREWAEEGHAGLAADPDGRFGVGERFGLTPGQAVKLRPECQCLGLKAPPAELLRQAKCGFRVAGRHVELHQRVPAEERRMVADHLCPALPDQRRPRDRGVGDRERAPDIPREEPGKGHHRPVRHLDTAEPVPLAQSDALAEPIVRADHATADILGIAEPAQRHRLEFGRPGRSREFQSNAVFAQAAFDAAARKAQIAANKMNARLLCNEMLRHGHRLGLLQIGHGSDEIVGNPLDPGKPVSRSSAAASSAACQARPASAMAPRSCRISPCRHISSKRSA